MSIIHDRGYLIPAIGDQYVECAERLRTSILKYHPHVDVTIVTEDMLPQGKLSGYANDWQMFRVSPYRQTIKLEADMLCCGSIDHWWTLFEHRDVVISQGARTYYNEPATSRYYRRIFDENNLPDVYNAVTYWRLSKTAQEFFALVRAIFEQWTEFRKLLKFPDDEATTDVVYAMAAQIMGVENVTLPVGVGPQIVHMKRKIIRTQTDNWTKELVWEHTDTGLRIQTIAQHGLVHYHIKDWK